MQATKRQVEFATKIGEMRQVLSGHLLVLMGRTSTFDQCIDACAAIAKTATRLGAVYSKEQQRRLRTKRV